MEFVHVELKRETWMKPEMKVQNEEDAIMAVKKLIQNLDREVVVSIQIATSGRVINASVCAMGCMNQAVVSPSEVLRTAILSGAYGILMIHNHPSGRCKPSSEDLNLAKKMATASAMMGIQLVDFIIVGACGFTHSVRGFEEEWLCPDYEWLNAGIVTRSNKEHV